MATPGGVWSAAFALSLSAAVAVALLRPDLVPKLEVNANLTLGFGCFFIGLGTTTANWRLLFTSSWGIATIAWSFFVGTFLWPALGLAAAVLGYARGLPFESVIGMALLASCPVGGPSNVVNIYNAGGWVEASALMALVSTPTALATFPYAFRAMCAMLADGAGPAVCGPACRKLLLSDLPPNVVTSIYEHALYAVVLPMLAGIVVQAAAPAGLRKRLPGVAPLLTACMIFTTVVTKTAANAGAVRAAGLPLAGLVVGLHCAALLLGYAMPRGVRVPEDVARTSALQASMRNPALGLGLAVALYGSSPALPLVAAPCVVSIFVQNTLGAWVGLVGRAAPPATRASTMRTKSLEAILKQNTKKKLA